jgi:hypothetical protein
MDYNMNELEIGTVSATFNADSLVANTVTIQGVSGKCIFTGNNAFGTMNVETVSGDVTFNGTLRQLTCEGVSANFRGYFTETPNSIQVDGVSGDIDITLPADAGFTAELDTLNGHFNSDFSTTSSGDRYICGNGQCRTVGKELFDLFVSLASASENEDRSFFNVEVKRKIISHMKLHSTALAAKINFEI